MVKFACCIPGGSLMPEGISDVPSSTAEYMCTQFRYLLKSGFDCTECGGKMLSDLTNEEKQFIIKENEKESFNLIAVNSLFPADFKLSDPSSDHESYIQYATSIFDMMNVLGAKYAVFGSGGARMLLEGDNEEKSRATLIDFIKKLADEAAKRNIILVIEPLNSGETNVFTTVEESAELVLEIKKDNLQLLCDSFHMALENTDPSVIKKYGNMIRHCHISEAKKRTYPGSPDSDYPSYNKVFASELNSIGYEGAVSIECSYNDFSTEAVKGLKFLKEIFL